MSKNPHFYFSYNFGALPHELADYDKTSIVILPVPYDATTTYKPGTRDGARAIIEASRSLEFYDEEAQKNFSDKGICTLDEIETVDSAKDMVNRVYEATQKLLNDNKKIAMIGGEHSVTSGAVKAYLEKYPKLTHLHIDAHADLEDEIGENKYSHGSVAKRILEMCPVVLVGTRSLSEEQATLIKEKNIPTFWAHKTVKCCNTQWMDEVVETLSGDVYVSIDLDALDPSIMPAVGTPVPGGLSWHQLLTLLRKINEKKNVVGFDVKEFMPIAGQHAPDFTAAKLIYKMIGMFYYDKQ